MSAIISVVTIVSAMVIITIVVIKCRNRKKIDQKNKDTRRPSAEKSFVTISIMDQFLSDMEKEKAIMFTSEQLEIATENYSKKLGSGGFGTVYKGVFGGDADETVVAVKVLNKSSDDRRVEEQFIAEVSTIGRVHHFNLVRLTGFCFENHTRALVYEYMRNGSLDNYLYHRGKPDGKGTALGFEKLHEIAVGTARGIAYLHEECQQRIIHYDIKPSNILLDDNLCPKVSDFGLAKLCNRENTHITMTGGRGTPGYAAPELWMPSPITHKCDVYSFGMLLFEIIGRRRNLDINLPENEQWFPRWVWERFNSGKLKSLRKKCGIKSKDKIVAERMVKVALLCVHYRPKKRPMMSTVVQMLEGLMEVPKPSNPFPLR